MDIYKLTDEVPVERLTKKHNHDIMRSEALQDGGISGGELVVTELKQGVKNPNRVNVFVNGKFSFSLDVAQVVDLGVKIGKKLVPSELDELKRASEFGKLYQRALEKALTRPHSEREMRDYLWRKLKMPSSGCSLRPSSRGSSLRPRSNCGCPSEGNLQFSRNNHGFPSEESFELSWQKSTHSPEDAAQLSREIIERLVVKGYVDDRKFAEYYVENRFVKKGISQKRLRMELMKKGVDKGIIDEVLVGRDDEAELRKMIIKKRARYDDEKLIQYLCRQGFSYDLVRKMVEEFDEVA